MEQWWNDTDGKTKELREKTVPVPLCPLSVKLGLCGEKPATNHLSYGSALCSWNIFCISKTTKNL
jgi:hypothetical protein